MKLENSIGSSDSFERFFRQTSRTESFLPFPQANDSSVKWFELLHALDKQRNLNTADACIQRECKDSMRDSGDLAKMTTTAAEGVRSSIPGWPLLSPSKVAVQKCEKCSREFYSSINYKRHIRVHRRSLKIDKVPPQQREGLRIFWDKLSLDDQKAVLSFENVILEDVSGSSIIKSLSSLIRAPRSSSLPSIYVGAGATLLDAIQATPSRIPISSQELFKTLDDASEKTFLSAGNAVSLQKFMFDGEIGETVLDKKNIIACTGYMLEQRLVNAWVADKDEEALRCQKLLMEEEEAAQNRRADLLERKRQKKLRQKAQKVKEHNCEDNCNVNDHPFNVLEELSCSVENLPEMPSFKHELGTPESSIDFVQPCLEVSQISDSDPSVEVDDRCHVDAGDHYRIHIGDNERHSNSTISQYMSLKSINGLNGFNTNHIPVAKPQNQQKHIHYKGLSSNLSVSGMRVWAPKRKVEDEVVSVCKDTVREETLVSTGKEEIQEEIIEEIVLSTCKETVQEETMEETMVTTGKQPVQEETVFYTCEETFQEEIMEETLVSSGKETIQEEIIERLDNDDKNAVLFGSLNVSLEDYNCNPVPVDNLLDEPTRQDPCLGVSGPTTIRWSPVSGQKINDFFMLQTIPNEVEIDGSQNEVTNSIILEQKIDIDKSMGFGNSEGPKFSRSTDISSLILFSSRLAEVFLIERWKEAISSEHVKIFHTSDSKSLDYSDDKIEEEKSSQLPLQDSLGRKILGNAENRMSMGRPIEVVTSANFKTKPERNIRAKYVPRQRRHFGKVN